MLLEERKFAIMELIKRDGFVSVRQLMDILGVSRSSVMRDLDELERQAIVKMIGEKIRNKPMENW